MEGNKLDLSLYTYRVFKQVLTKKNPQIKGRFARGKNYNFESVSSKKDRQIERSFTLLNFVEFFQH